MSVVEFATVPSTSMDTSISSGLEIIRNALESLSFSDSENADRSLMSPSALASSRTIASVDYSKTPSSSASYVSLDSTV